MSDGRLLEQAVILEQLLPRLMRRMFALDADHPANELPVAQLRVCAILQQGPRTLSSLSEELSISSSAVTQIADRLERAGLVERSAGRDDRRLKNLQLTEQGDALMRSRREIRVQRAADALAQLSDGERGRVMDTLESLLEAAIAARAPHSDNTIGTLMPLVERQQVGN